MLQGATTSIILEPATKGTKIIYDMDYELPYSVLGKLIGKLRVSKDMKKTQTKMLENMKKALEACKLLFLLKFDENTATVRLQMNRP